MTGAPGWRGGTSASVEGRQGRADAHRRPAPARRRNRHVRCRALQHESGVGPGLDRRHRRGGCRAPRRPSLAPRPGGRAVAHGRDRPRHRAGPARRRPLRTRPSPRSLRPRPSPRRWPRRADVPSSWPEASEEPAGAEASGVVLGLVRPPATDELAVGATAGARRRGGRSVRRPAVRRRRPGLPDHRLRGAPGGGAVAPPRRSRPGCARRSSSGARSPRRAGRPSSHASTSSWRSPRRGSRSRPTTHSASSTSCRSCGRWTSTSCRRWPTVSVGARRARPSSAGSTRCSTRADRPRRPSDPPELFSGDEAPAGSIAP